MDEYGEFIRRRRRRRPGRARPRPYDDEPELPGLTDEALRLLEVAREELAAAEAANPTTPVVPLAVSGFLTSRKRATAAELADWIDSPEGRASSLESIGRSLSRRNHGRSRAVVLAHDHDEAVKGLRALAEGKQSPLVLAADGPVTNGPVWVLAGFGAQHRKMGKSLYLRDEIFAEWINKVDALVQDERGYSIVELILDDAIDYTDETCDYPIEVVQTVIFAIQVALGELLKAHGAKPGALVGQSLGEAAAAYFSGGLSLADATRTICSRAHLMGEGEAMLFGEYIRLMALVEYSADEIKTVFSDFPDLEVCVYAAPTQTVIGGPPEQVDAIIARAESEGKFARKFQTKGASHTQQMDPLLGELAAETAGHRAASAADAVLLDRARGQADPRGRRADPRRRLLEEGPAAQRVLHARHPQRRRQRAHHVPRAGAEPGGAHAGWADDGVGAGLHDAQLIATLARKQDEVDSMTTAMAHAVRATATTWTSARCSRAGRRPGRPYADIPPTRFKRKPHWLDVQFTGDGSTVMPGTHVATPDGRHVWEYAPRGDDRSGRAGESRCGAGASGCQADGVRAARGARRRRPAGDDADPAPRRGDGAGARPDRRVVHARLRRDRDPRRSAQSALPTAVGAGTAVDRGRRSHAGAVEPEPEDDAAILQDNLTAGAGLAAGFAKWSPDSGETIGERLGTIVGSAMGYEPEDLPWEVPLIELGLDSLMAVRIKNRVEYDFDLPPIQLTAVRDANLYAVEKLIAVRDRAPRRGRASSPRCRRRRPTRRSPRRRPS